MAIEQRLFENRDRADSFGAVADDYDRFRPSYPSALIDDLVSDSPGRLLDVGCGTGKAARLFAAKGIDVLGVEPDARMAAVARSHGLTVEVGPFETWDPAGRTFDLITSAQAWHWVNPTLAVPKAARLLNPGSTIALFWNYDVLPAAAAEAVDRVYEKLAPSLMTSIVKGGASHAERPYPKTFDASGLFEPAEITFYESDRTDTAEEWTRRVATHSDHLLLPAPQRVQLLTALTAALEDLGPVVTSNVTTYLMRARLR